MAIRSELPPDVTNAEEEVVEPGRRPPDRYWWLWLVLLLLVVVGGLLAWFFLSRGSDKTTVPNVIGLTEQAATQRIHDRGLDVTPRVGQSSRPQGIVFAEKPGPGTQVGKKQSVTIFISSGGIVVPDVTGLPLLQAEAELKKMGLAFDVKRVASTRPKGVVLDQAPPAGVKAVGGTAVKLSVSNGLEPVVVPRVVGQSQGAAVAALTKLGLKPVLQNVPSAKPAGIVVAQKPPAGKEVDKRSEVIVEVSTGRATTTTVQTTTTTTGGTAAGPVRVPQVVGAGVVIGLRRLNALELRPVVHYVSSTQPAGRIVFESPASGTVPRGSRVQVRVSTGPNPAAAAPIPDVRGQDRDAAVSTLRSAGFRVLVLYRKTSDQTQDGLVLEQQPVADSSIPSGSVVAIFVGRFA